MTTHFTPDLATFRTLAQQGNLIPVHAEFIADAETPVGAFAKLDDGGYTFLFESVEKSEQTGRYSFVIVGPRVVMESNGRTIRITEDGATREFQSEKDPLADLEKYMSRFRYVPLPDEPPEFRTRFFGGAVGYLGYDIVRFFEPSVPAAKGDQLGLPESLFVLAETVLIFDHLKRRLRIVANAFVQGDADAAYARATKTIADIAAKLAKPNQLPSFPIAPPPPPAAATSNTTREEFHARVRKAHEYIHAGDIFQVVPSQRFTTDYTGDPLTLYRALRFVNPSPYMFCMKFPAAQGRAAFSFVGSSPEVHVRAVNGKIEIRPIAGTRKRGVTHADDLALEKDLLADQKERAEHLMLVDLARNDIGRVCQYGTVTVPESFVIERYSHVMHIVSQVEGQIAPEKTAYDLMRATFPAGTVSGAPKIRAMQIIAENEPSQRGFYAGALGYFGYDGNSDTCIMLRTSLIKDGQIHIQAGAGVVADSIPTSEYQETVNKASALFKAVAMAEQF